MILFPLRKMNIAQTAFLVMLTTANANGANVTFSCPEGEAGSKLLLSYANDALSIADGNVTTSLPATIQGDAAGIFTVYGSGPMDATMPEPAAMDACLSAKLKEQGVTADDKDMLAYDSNACRVELIPNGTIQKVQAQLTLTSIDKGKATLFIQRQYLTPSTITGLPLQLDEFPTRNCDVVLMP